MTEPAIQPLFDSRPTYPALLAAPPIDAATYIALLGHLNAAHRTVTDHVRDGALPARLRPVHDAINLAIERTQQARVGADAE